MKNILSIFFVSLLVSCGSQVSDLELRVAKLETEIASMRKGGVSTIVPAGAFPKFAFNEEEYNFGDTAFGGLSVVYPFKDELILGSYKSDRIGIFTIND